MAKKYDFSDKVILVTGASDGMGREIAERLGETGASVVVTARRLPQLEAVAARINDEGGRAIVIPADLRDPNQIAKLVRDTMEAFGRIDVLINVAGMGYYDWIDELTAAELQEQFQTNVIGLIELIRQVVPATKREHQGHIINFASYASRIATPPLTIYASTKYAIEGISDGLRRELGPWGIKVTRVHPSAVNTNFNAKAEKHGGIHYPFDKLTGVTKEYAAQKILAVIHRPRTAVYIAKLRPLIELGVLVNRFLPGIIDFAFRFRTPKMWRGRSEHDLQAHAAGVEAEQTRLKQA